MRKKSILFGFYKGLGDFISDAHLIEVLIRKGFEVTVVVSDWFSSLAKFMLPVANVIGYKNSKDLANIDYSHDYIFLTPNYLHPLKMEPRALWLYLSKLALVKSKAKSSVIITPKYHELFSYYLQVKKTFLDEHFYIMSLHLLRRYFPYIKFKPPIWKKSKKPNINRVLIFPFSGNDNKDYSPEKYKNIGRYLKDKYKVDIVFLVAKKDLHLAQIFYPEFKVKSLSLIEIAKMIQETDLVISGDTGPAHLSAYYDANLLVLYGYTKPEKYKPIGKGRIETIYSPSRVKDIPEEAVINKIEHSFNISGGYNEPKVIYMHTNLQ